MKRSFQAAALILVTAGATMLASCSSKITDEQLAELQKLRNQEQTLTQQINAAKQERSKLQGEVKAQQSQLDQCNSNKQFVNGKLQQWPNVWPDWQYTEDSGTESTPNH